MNRFSAGDLVEFDLLAPVTGGFDFVSFQGRIAPGDYLTNLEGIDQEFQILKIVPEPQHVELLGDNPLNVPAGSVRLVGLC